MFLAKPEHSTTAESVSPKAQKSAIKICRSEKNWANYREVYWSQFMKVGIKKVLQELQGQWQD